MENKRFDNFASLITGAQKSMQRIKAQQMSKLGLSSVHMMCLRAIYKNPAGLTKSELSAECEVDKALVSRITSELTKKGCISQVRGRGIYKSRYVLTEMGEDAAERINATVDNVVKFVSRDIPENALNSFYETLEHIYERLKLAEKVL